MQGGFTNHVSVLSAQNAEQTEHYVCRNTNTLINQCGFWTFLELHTIWSLNSVPLRSIFSRKFCSTRVDDLGLLCLIAYSLITIDKQQALSLLWVFCKGTCCRKLWRIVWWIEIHKMCFETVKELGEFEIKQEHIEIVNWNTADVWFHWQIITFANPCFFPLFHLYCKW